MVARLRWAGAHNKIQIDTSRALLPTLEGAQLKTLRCTKIYSVLFNHLLFTIWYRRELKSNKKIKKNLTNLSK